MQQNFSKRPREYVEQTIKSPRKHAALTRSHRVGFENIWQRCACVRVIPLPLSKFIFIFEQIEFVNLLFVFSFSAVLCVTSNAFYCILEESGSPTVTKMPMGEFGARGVENSHVFIQLYLNQCCTNQVHNIKNEVRSTLLFKKLRYRGDSKRMFK